MPDVKMIDCMSQGAIGRSSARRIGVGALQRACRMYADAVERYGRAAEHDQFAHGLAVDIFQPRAKIGMHDHQARFRQADGVLEQAAAIGGVDRYEHRAEIVESEPDPQAVGIVRQPHQDALALFDSERAQRVRRANRQRLHLSIGPLLAVGENGECLVGLLARPPLDHVPLDTLHPAAACAGPNDSPWSFLPAPQRSLRSTFDSLLARRPWPWRFRRTVASWSSSFHA